MKNKRGRPTIYKPEYPDMIVQFFSPPHFLYKDMTITKSDGTKIDKTVIEPCPPLFLSDFAKSISIPLPSYRNTFRLWAKKHEDFSHALKVAKELEEERVRVNGIMGLYNPAFSIFTMKNIAGWRDKSEIEGKGFGNKTTVVNIIRTYKEEKHEASSVRADTRIGEQINS